MTRSGWRAPTLMKTPLFSQSSAGAAVSIWVEVGRCMARVDVLAARETCEHVGATVAHAAGLGVEQIAVVGLERVADVGEGGAVREDELPISARHRGAVSR